LPCPEISCLLYKYKSELISGQGSLGLQPYRGLCCMFRKMGYPYEVGQKIETRTTRKNTETHGVFLSVKVGVFRVVRVPVQRYVGSQSFNLKSGFGLLFFCRATKARLIPTLKVLTYPKFFAASANTGLR